MSSLKARLTTNIVGLLLLAVFTLPLQAEGRSDRRCKVVVIAFVGGIGTARFPPSVAVPLLHRVRSLGYPGACVKEFSAYCPWCAHRWLRKVIAEKRNRPLTDEGLESQPRLILYGYSLGAPSALYLARLLGRDGVPIELTITVDSKGFTRGILPRNVKVAANFYEKESFPFVLSGKSDIRPADPQATDFLGNIRVEHVGHLTIAGSAPVEQLLLRTTRVFVYKGESYAAELDDVIGFLPVPSYSGGDCSNDKQKCKHWQDQHGVYQEVLRSGMPSDGFSSLEYEPKSCADCSIPKDTDCDRCYGPRNPVQE